MPAITEVHRALWYGLVYFVAIVGAWIAVTLGVIAGRLLRRRSRPASTSAAPRELPDLQDDPELHRFFARVNHAYRRRPPPHVEAPLPGTSPLNQPSLLHEEGDPPVIAVAPAPEPYSVKADPFVLHSAPFYSPREDKPAAPRPLAKPAVQTAPLRSPTPAQPAEAPPMEHDLVVMVNIWARLSEKDRRELLALARIKAGLDKS